MDIRMRITGRNITLKSMASQAIREGLCRMIQTIFDGSYRTRQFNAWGWQKFWEKAEKDSAANRLYAQMLLEEKKEEARRKQIDREVKIIKEAKDFRRIGAAVYRLYRFLDVHPKEIAYLAKINIETVKNHIAETFKETCLKEESCVFKRFFE